jgi:hypothetical protein
MVCEGAIENCTFGAVLAKLNLLANKSIYWPLVEWIWADSVGSLSSSTDLVKLAAAEKGWCLRQSGTHVFILRSTPLQFYIIFRPILFCSWSGYLESRRSATPLKNREKCRLPRLNTGVGRKHTTPYCYCKVFESVSRGADFIIITRPCLTTAEMLITVCKAESLGKRHRLRSRPLPKRHRWLVEKRYQLARKSLVRATRGRLLAFTQANGLERKGVLVWLPLDSKHIIWWKLTSRPTDKKLFQAIE